MIGAHCTTAHTASTNGCAGGIGASISDVHCQSCFMPGSSTLRSPAADELCCPLTAESPDAHKGITVNVRKIFATKFALVIHMRDGMGLMGGGGGRSDKVQ